jgi:O-antigen ligase/polysaccharide polymerase Wzy-like membrane protein
MTVLAAVALTAGLFVRFLQLERSGRSASVVYLVLAVVVVETALYPDPNNVPPSIFHPTFGGGTNFRLQDIVIPAALLARVLVRGGAQRLSLPVALWSGVLCWLAVAAVVGVYGGNSTTLVLFEAKAILYIGAFALTLGVPTSELFEPRRFDRFVFATAVLAALATIGQESSLSLNSHTALVPLAETGGVGADGASLYATVAVFALAIGMTRERGRLPLLIAAVPLLASVPAEGQRAAMIDAAVALLVLAAATLLRQRFRTTPTELALVTSAIVAVLLVPVVVGGVVGSGSTSVPLQSAVSTAFNSTGKKLSAQSRVNQLDAVKSQIAQQPFFGWGLGKEYTFYDPGPQQFLTTNLTHDIVTDLLLRTGAFGLLLFLAAVVGTVASGLGAWRRSVDDAVAAVALAGTAALVGLLAKGLVESIFEKYRLAALLGLLVGVTLRAATVEQTAATTQPSAAARPAPVRSGRA